MYNEGNVMDYEKDKEDLLNQYDAMLTGPMKQKAKEEFIKRSQGEITHLLSVDKVIFIILY
jgi:hypothetical protein